MNEERTEEVFTTSVTYPLSFVTQIFRSGDPRPGDDRKTFEVQFRLCLYRT